MVEVVALVGLRQKEIHFPYPVMLMHGQRSSHHALFLRSRLRECCLPCCGSHLGLPVATFVVVFLPMVALKAIVIESLGTPPVVALLVIVIVIAASLRLRLVHARGSEGCFAY